jgi:hypothetical protein
LYAAADVAFIGNQLYALSSGGGCSHGIAREPAGIAIHPLGQRGSQMTLVLDHYRADIASKQVP